MSLLLLLLVGALAAGGTAWALPRGGASARLGTIAGVVALALIALLALASPTPAASGASGGDAAAGTLWNGALVPGAYLRTTVALWAGASIVVTATTWLLRGTSALRTVLPATLAALVGTAVALGASTPQMAFVAAGATGLASVPVLLASSRAGLGVAAREVRIAVATAAVGIGVAAAMPVISRLALASPDASAEGSGVAVATAFAMLALALVVAARVGMFPYQVRVAAVADAAPAGSLALLLVWLPLPMVAVAVGVTAGLFAPLGVAVGPAQGVVIALALLATVAAALAAGLQDDLRHAVAYLALADLGLVVLAVASLDAGAWAPARTWLLMAALTKTALAAWAVVAEDRFETRSIPELRGWLRPAPTLGLALLLIVVATYGLPGWAVLSARIDLTRLAAGGPWDGVLVLASLLTLPAYARWLWLGIAAPSSHVDRAAPELVAVRLAAVGAGRLAPRLPSRSAGRAEGLPVQQERLGVPDLPPAARPLREPRSTSDSANGTHRIRVPGAERTEGTMAHRIAVPPELQGTRPYVPETEPSRGEPVAEALLPLSPAEPLRPEADAARVVPDVEPVAPSAVTTGSAAGVRLEDASSDAREGRALPQEAPVGHQEVATTEHEPSAAAPAGEAPRPRAARSRRAPAKRTAQVNPDDAPVGADRADVAEAPRPDEAPPAAAKPDDPDQVNPADAPKPGVGPAETLPPTPEVRPGIGVSARSRAAAKRTRPSAMASSRHPEASVALPPEALEAARDEEPAGNVLSRRARRPASPGATERAAAAVRRRRTDLLSTAVLALALLAALVAFGAFDVAGAAREATPAVPITSSLGN